MVKSSFERFRSLYFHDGALGLCLDLSRLAMEEGFLSAMEPAIQKAFGKMADLERGAIANPDEQRMVGHYWLRAPELAPSADLRGAIEGTGLGHGEEPRE